MDGWTEITDAGALRTALGFNPIAPEAFARLLDAVTEAPHCDEYVKVRTEYPRLPSGLSGYLIPRTRIFFNIRKCKEFWGDAMVALATYLITQSTQACLHCCDNQEDVRQSRPVSEEEAEVVHVLIGLSRGDPYAIPVSEEALKSAYTDATVSINRLLDALERKHVLERRREGMLLLVY